MTDVKNIHQKTERVHDDTENGREPDDLPLLLPHHREMLVKGSGIDPSVILARGYRSVSTLEELQWLGLGPHRALGLIVPVHPPSGDKPVPVYRADEPGEGRPKYEWPSNTPTRLDVPAWCQDWLDDVTVPIWFPEGCRKGDALVTHLMKNERKQCVVNLAGVWNFGAKPPPGHPILSDWEHIRLNGRDVRIGYDSDAWVKPELLRALWQFTAFLQRRGALVRWVRLEHLTNGLKAGIDDFLLTHTLDELEGMLVEPEMSPMLAPDLTDMGNAARFEFLFRNTVRHCEERGWLVYDGRCWKRAPTKDIRGLAMDTVTEFSNVVRDLPPGYTDLDKFQNHAQHSQHAARIAATAFLAESLKTITVAVTELDANPDLLNVANGTLNVRTGELQPHDPNDLLTKIAPVNYDPLAKSPDLDQFIKLFTSGQVDVAVHLQRIAGYCLTTSMREGSVFFLLGPTRTGKTTFLNAMLGMLGDYAWKAAFDSFLVGRRPGTVRDDISQMEGKRLIVASEVTHGHRLDEAIVKELTGEDEINARGLYEKGRNFRPVLKLMLAANDAPHIRSDDSGTWARLNLIRCENAEFQEREYLDLKERVMNVELTGSALLAWAMKGCLDWRREGHLARPPSVDDATRELRETFEPLREFLTDTCVAEEGAEIKNVELRGAYVAWCQRMGEKNSIGTKRFSQELIRLGFQQKKSGARLWVGIRLKKFGEGEGNPTNFEKSMGS